MKIRRLIKNCFTMYYVKEMIFISPFRRTLMKLIAYTTLLVFGLLMISIVQILATPNYNLEKSALRYPTDLKYILFWKRIEENVVKSHKGYRGSRLPEGQNIFITQRCKFINCFITYNKHFLGNNHQNLDAIVFNIREIMDLTPTKFGLTRSANQKYIFNSLQSSDNYPICDSVFDNFFNWTWTYKLNSDIPQPLINVFNSKNQLVGPRNNMSWTAKMVPNTRFVNKMSNKTKAVAWIISKCQTKVKYEDYIGELKNELKGYNHTLDVYGVCADNKCPGSHITNCFKLLEKKYFFQLIVEDSFAEDYVSEKIVKAMTRIVIPILIGSSNYNNFLPPGSYINAQTFDMKKLGAIIDYLIKNPTTYRHFFDWKNHYYYTVRPRSLVCDLCEKLNNSNDTSPTTYSSFKKWWNPNYKETCLQKRLDKV